MVFPTFFNLSLNLAIRSLWSEPQAAPSPVFVHYASVFFWQNSISLCPASFYTPRPNLPVTPGVSWHPTFAFQSPIMIREWCNLWGVLGLVGLHRTIQLQLLQHYWSGHRLGLLWYWKQTKIILLFLRLHPSNVFWTLLLTMMVTPFLLRDSCLQ